MPAVSRHPVSWKWVMKQRLLLVMNSCGETAKWRCQSKQCSLYSACQTSSLEGTGVQGRMLQTPLDTIDICACMSINCRAHQTTSEDEAEHQQANGPQLQQRYFYLVSVLVLCSVVNSLPRTSLKRDGITQIAQCHSGRYHNTVWCAFAWGTLLHGTVHHDTMSVQIHYFIFENLG